MKKNKKPFIGWLVLGVAMIIPSFLPPSQAINVKAGIPVLVIRPHSQTTETEYDPCGLAVVQCKNEKIVYVENNLDTIKRISNEYGIDWKIIYSICMVESHCKANTIGDSNQSYGAFQIHLPSHPDITKEQAYDFEFSVRWTIEHGLKYKDNPSLFSKNHNGMGKQNQWYVDRFNSIYKNI